MSNKLYFLALNRMNQIGPRTVSKLMKRWPDLQQMFQLSAHELEQAGLPERLATTIARFDLKLIDEDLAWEQAAANHHIMTWESPEYPALLKEIADPPVVLYVQGQLSALQQPTLAVVGSRNPSITGSENARYFSRDLAAHGLTIVSGLALGVDAQAHLGCLEVKGQTIAVLGTGVDHIYPRRHLKLAQQIQEDGLLMSEFPLKSPPIAGHFPRRNRIISGLSLCTLVVEAAIKSGSLITARMALEQNRDVLAIPGSIHNPLARGCHYLLQQGATLVTSINDILNELRLEPQARTVDKTLISLATEKGNLVQFIGFETTSIDQIVVRSGFSIELITNKLAELEIQGSVVAVPGGYIRC
jgi:DNA processing protein